MLIVKGVKDFDDLKRLGLPMAKQVADADTVVAIDELGKAHVLKSKVETGASFVDGTSKLSAFASIMKEISDRYVQEKPKTGHLAHAVVGMWFFYWMANPRSISPLPVDMAHAGDLKGLRESARSFIEADFGDRALQLSKIRQDGRSDAETEGAPDPGSAGPAAA